MKGAARPLFPGGAAPRCASIFATRVADAAGFPIALNTQGFPARRRTVAAAHDRGCAGGCGCSVGRHITVRQCQQCAVSAFRARGGQAYAAGRGLAAEEVDLAAGANAEIVRAARLAAGRAGRAGRPIGAIDGAEKTDGCCARLARACIGRQAQSRVAHTARAHTNQGGHRRQYTPRDLVAEHSANSIAPKRTNAYDADRPSRPR